MTETCISAGKDMDIWLVAGTYMVGGRDIYGRGQVPSEPRRRQRRARQMKDFVKIVSGTCGKGSGFGFWDLGFGVESLGFGSGVWGLRLGCMARG